MNLTNNPKFDKVAKDPRISMIRNATFAEADGERGWVMVTFAEGFSYRGDTQYLAANVAEIRAFLKELEVADV